jgi:hypothetical protein
MKVMRTTISRLILTNLQLFMGGTRDMLEASRIAACDENTQAGFIGATVITPVADDIQMRPSFRRPCAGEAIVHALDEKGRKDGRGNH